VNEARSHPDKGKSCCTSTRDYGLDVRCQWKNKEGGERKDVNSKEIRWRGKNKLPRGKEAHFAVCFDGAIKQSRGRKWTDDSLEESSREFRKTEWRMDKVGDWMSKLWEKSSRLMDLQSLVQKLEKLHSFTFFWVKSAVPQQIHNNTGPSISTFAIAHTSVLLPLFFNPRPSCTPPVTQH